MLTQAGARLWAQRARAELCRADLRAAVPGQLTASGRPVAGFAAARSTS